MIVVQVVDSQIGGLVFDILLTMSLFDPFVSWRVQLADQVGSLFKYRKSVSFTKIICKLTVAT